MFFTLCLPWGSVTFCCANIFIRFLTTSIPLSLDAFNSRTASESMNILNHHLKLLSSFLTLINYWMRNSPQYRLHKYFNLFSCKCTSIELIFWFYKPLNDAPSRCRARHKIVVVLPTPGGPEIEIAFFKTVIENNWLS